MGALRTSEILSVLNFQQGEGPRVFFATVTRLAICEQMPDIIKNYIYERALILNAGSSAEMRTNDEMTARAKNFFAQVKYLVDLGFHIDQFYVDANYDVTQKEKFDAYMRALMAISTSKLCQFNQVTRQEINDHTVARVANHLENLRLPLNKDNRKAGHFFDIHFKNIADANKDEIDICRGKTDDVPGAISHLLAYHFTKGNGDSAIAAARHLFQGWGILRPMEKPYFQHFQDIKKQHFLTLMDHLDNPDPVILLIHQDIELTAENIAAATAFRTESQELKALPDGFCRFYQSVQGQGDIATANDMRWAATFLAAWDQDYGNTLVQLLALNLKRRNQLPQTVEQLNFILSQFFKPPVSNETDPI